MNISVIRFPLVRADTGIVAAERFQAADAARFAVNVEIRAYRNMDALFRDQRRAFAQNQIDKAGHFNAVLNGDALGFGRGVEASFRAARPIGVTVREGVIFFGLLRAVGVQVGNAWTVIQPFGIDGKILRDGRFRVPCRSVGRVKIPAVELEERQGGVLRLCGGLAVLHPLTADSGAAQRVKPDKALGGVGVQRKGNVTNGLRVKGKVGEIRIRLAVRAVRSGSGLEQIVLRELDGRLDVCHVVLAVSARVVDDFTAGERQLTAVLRMDCARAAGVFAACDFAAAFHAVHYHQVSRREMDDTAVFRRAGKSAIQRIAVQVEEEGLVDDETAFIIICGIIAFQRDGSPLRTGVNQRLQIAESLGRVGVRRKRQIVCVANVIHSAVAVRLRDYLRTGAVRVGSNHCAILCRKLKGDIVYRAV